MIKTTTINAGKYYWVKTCKACDWRIAEAYILVLHMRLRFTDGSCVPVDSVHSIVEAKPPRI